MKILSSKRYKKLLEYKDKYNYLIGQTITICIGGRTRRSRLLGLSKEELVRRYIELDNYCYKMQKNKKGVS